jgi:hypothetical protein
MGVYSLTAFKKGEACPQGLGEWIGARNLRCTNNCSVAVITWAASWRVSSLRGRTQSPKGW